MEKYTEWKKKIEKIISQVEGNVCINFYDLNKNNGFSVNGDKKVLSASMIKLLILAELMKKIFENKFSLSDTVMMANFMKIEGDGVLKVMKYHLHKYNYHSLFFLLLHPSFFFLKKFLLNPILFLID